jgi:flagellar hook-associated protein 3 FlgL
MRVTQNSMASSVLANLQNNVSRLGQLQQRLSSGKEVSRPSDSPAGTVSVMEFRSQIAANKQYARNADDGLGWLATADSALQASSTEVTRARSLVLQGLSTGSSSPQNRAALAAEIRQISDTLLDLANTTYLDRPVFGGTTSGSAAFAATTGVWDGDETAVMRTAGANTKVQVNVLGTDVYGVDDETVFNVLSDIATKLEGDPSTLKDDLVRLDAKSASIQAGLATVGARYNQLERMRQAADDNILRLTTALTDVESIDLPKTITELQLQQTAYQAALAAGARVVQPSLVDFLR